MEDNTVANFLGRNGISDPLTELLKSGPRAYRSTEFWAKNTTNQLI